MLVLRFVAVGVGTNMVGKGVAVEGAVVAVGSAAGAVAVGSREVGVGVSGTAVGVGASGVGVSVAVASNDVAEVAVATLSGTCSSTMPSIQYRSPAVACEESQKRSRPSATGAEKPSVTNSKVNCCHAVDRST